MCQLGTIQRTKLRLETVEYARTIFGLKEIKNTRLMFSLYIHRDVFTDTPKRASVSYSKLYLILPVLLFIWCDASLDNVCVVSKRIKKYFCANAHKFLI